MSWRVQVKDITDNPGYVTLRVTNLQNASKPIRVAVDERGCLSAVKLTNKFMGELQQCLQQCQEEAWSRDWPTDSLDEQWKLEKLRCIKDRIKLRRHGPAVQMDVMHWPATPQKLFFSVDMVPAIQIPGRNDEDDRYFVPKPIKKGSDQIEWRWSFSLKEKERLATLDRYNGCRKQVLRVLKVIRNRDTALARLTSYHLKTALFRKIDELRDEVHWRSDRLGQRLMDVIGQMEKELSRGVMPHYFLPRMNLLCGIKDQAVDNMRCRLSRMWNNEREMLNVLQRCANTNVTTCTCGGRQTTLMQNYPRGNIADNDNSCYVVLAAILVAVLAVVVGWYYAPR